MFSNSTEGDMFTGKWCSNCRFGFEGDLCEEAFAIVWGGPAPKFLRRVDPSPSDPTGVICTRFKPL